MNPRHYEKEGVAPYFWERARTVGLGNTGAPAGWERARSAGLGTRAHDWLAAAGARPRGRHASSVIGVTTEPS
jgi:hypothetical protein